MFDFSERKKKLRVMLRKKAVEELKKEQERKAAERIHTIGVRCGSKKELVKSPSLNTKFWQFLIPLL